MFEELLPLLLPLCSIGLIAGLLAGMMGIGGGIVLVPGLYYSFTALGYDPDIMMHMAVGTSLMIMVPTALSSARAHWQKNAVRTDLVRSIGPGILTGVVIGTGFAAMISGEGLKLFFAIAIAVLAFFMFLEPGRLKLLREMPSAMWRYVAGTVIGTVSCMMGIGGAVMNVPFMRMGQVPIHSAVGTAAALGLFVSIPGVIGFSLIGHGIEGRPPFSLGYAHIPASVIIAPVSVLCAPVGAMLAHWLPVKTMQRVFALFMMIVAVQIFFSVFHG